MPPWQSRLCSLALYGHAALTRVEARARDPGREKQEVFPAAATDGFTAARLASLRLHHCIRSCSLTLDMFQILLREKLTS
jgi:hypothetical protein